MNISLIHQALSTYKHEKQSYLLPVDKVKPSQLENALKHICKDGIVGSPVALMDTTLFGSGKEGVLITEHNLYIRIGGRDKISINDLRLVEQNPIKKTDIAVSYWGRPTKHLYASIYAQDLAAFLSRLAAYNNQDRQKKMEEEAQKSEKTKPVSPASPPVQTPRPASPAPKPVQEAVTEPYASWRNCRVGDRIRLGTYLTGKNQTKGPIDWVVLDKQADKMLVLSERVLGFERFTDVTPDAAQPANWGTSPVRRWLFETFEKEAFTEAEREAIAYCDLTTSSNPDFDAVLRRDPKCGKVRYSTPSPDTRDRVFLLSWEEVCKYLCGGEMPTYQFCDNGQGAPLDEELQWYSFTGKGAVASVTEHFAEAYSLPNAAGVVPDTGDWLLRNACSVKEILYVTSGEDCFFDNTLELSLADFRDAGKYPRPAPGSIRICNALRLCGIRPAMWLRLDAPSTQKTPVFYPAEYIPAPEPKPTEKPKPAAPRPVQTPKAEAPKPKPVAPAPKAAPARPAEKVTPAAPAPRAENTAGTAKLLQGVNVGDRISFGRYPTAADGTKAPIEWVVLDKQPDRVLVLSTHILDAQPFSKTGLDRAGTPNWEESHVRRWLNYHFLQDAFTPAEANTILSTTLSTSVNPDHDSYLKANPRSGEPRCAMSSPDTEDALFLLSWEEVCKYLCGGEQPKLRYSEDEDGERLDDNLQWYSFSTEKAAAPVTGYSDRKLQEESPWGSWLLRSSHSAEEILLVTSGNDIHFDGVLELTLMLNDLDIQSDRPAPGSILLRSTTEAYGIRPAMWLKLDVPESKPTPPAAASCNAAQLSAASCEKLALEFEHKWEAELEKYRHSYIPEAAAAEISDHLNRAIYWARTGRNKGSTQCGELLGQLLSYRASDWSLRSTKGSTVYFGRYPTSKGGKDAPIPWTVLAKVGDRKLLVVSKYVLDWRVFADTAATGWADASIRSWLNGEFLEKAFREYGTENIPETTVHTSVNPDYDCILKTDPHPDISRYTAPSPDTTDRVFLLSWEEVCKYLCNGETPEVRSSGFVDGKRTFRQQLRWYHFQNYQAYAEPTDYVEAIAPQYYEDVSSAPIWMLRNPCSASQLLVVDDGRYLWDAERKGIYQHRSNAAYHDPDPGSICVRELTEPYGVRPAMWLELDGSE